MTTLLQVIIHHEPDGDEDLTRTAVMALVQQRPGLEVLRFGDNHDTDDLAQSIQVFSLTLCGRSVTGHSLS